MTSRVGSLILLDKVDLARLFPACKHENGFAWTLRRSPVPRRVLRERPDISSGIKSSWNKHRLVSFEEKVSVSCCRRDNIATHRSEFSAVNLHHAGSCTRESTQLKPCKPGTLGPLPFNRRYKTFVCSKVGLGHGYALMLQIASPIS